MVLPKKVTKPVTVKFMLDCKIPAEDNILDPASLEKYLCDSIKVEGKTGNFVIGSEARGNIRRMLTITRDKHRIAIDAVLPFKKRYIKYLTKKYLQKHTIRDYLRVISDGPTSYQLRYYAKGKMSTEAKEN